MEVFLWFFCIFVALGCGTKVRYDNYQVYRVTPATASHVSALRNLEDNLAFNLWSDVTFINRSIDVMVSPHLKNYFHKYLSDIEHHLWIEDVQKLIDNQTSARLSGYWTSYHSLSWINKWLKKLSEEYPEKVTIVNAGTSYEGRDIRGVKVSFKPGNKIVFLEGGIHAREWISPATTTFILNKVLTNKNPEVQKVVESFDWYVFPSVNPDGYEHTRKNNRLWRKSRKLYTNRCIGSDLNRNWGYKWMHGGASSNPCSDVHAGTEPFSDVEAKSLSEFITSISEDLVAYLSFHSYSQLILIPFGHHGLEIPANDVELHIIGNKAVNKLAERYGTKYEVGNIPHIIYVASGSSADWVAGTFRHVRLVYTFELRDTGGYGFLLPPDQIIPTGEETFDAVMSMLSDIL